MSDASDDSEAAVRHSGEQPPAMPRWVRVSLIVAGVLLVALVVLKLTGAAGQHGPGRHQSTGGHSSYPGTPTEQSGSGL